MCIFHIKNIGEMHWLCIRSTPYKGNLLCSKSL
ncbi:hypothetical protein DMX09_10765 [Pseudomonas protegens]|nr:hypothetical protein DWF74_17065 [Pseudomonas protegens]MBW8354326.1 hypothetical protein [Pseudomonas sp.]NBF01611.1 hypothetical protein [Pseudomonas sp. Fl5BN2]NBF07123.1 hypothetical protein [Pseudomonas sp. Fl4BN1]PYY89857.1 hypothetical protein DNK62_05700 [Pseudomonas sp. TKO30]PYY92944.1 hypothetical protein DNK61_05700 [Pseudomonas sp. TKO29]PYY95308.1 hypothetical protein DNK59_05700 [Pseudomonas sp. TKO26]PYZ01393.1 hypothetical protein DNK60_05700 [Pseudomonas sp. TKO14]